MRTNGILLAISSLPSNYGIGDFGKNACTFIKYLEKANIKIWQILPINPLGYGNSPYQSIAGNAIDPIYISLDYLKTQGYIHSKLENVNSNSLRVDYDIVRKHKEKYLFEAYKNSNDKNEVDKFLKKNKWCKEYSRFQILLKKNSFDNWWKRDKNERYAHYNNFDYSPYIKEIDYLEWLQYIAYKQFGTLKAFAKEHGVKIMGDIPFYVGGMSSDMWANQDDFLLDENDIPTDVAGVPPDYFSATGQRWGNPIYDWEVMKEDNFNFLISRIKNAANLYDLLRIDHFRAFDTYYKIPSESETAIEGSWEKAYGNEFFDNFFQAKLK